jgi:acetyltransferase-like isoleucine patch superfamily enzyme
MAIKANISLGVAWLRAEEALRGTAHGRRPILRGPRPRISGREHITIGNSLTIRDRVHLDAPGKLLIGDGVLLNGCGILATTTVTIGDWCKLAPDALIRDTDTHQLIPGAPPRAAPITLGRNVWIGQRAIVLPGVTIGDNSVIAAGAVVTSTIPANAVAAGVPAKVTKELPPPPPGWRRE